MKTEIHRVLLPFAGVLDFFLLTRVIYGVGVFNYRIMSSCVFSYGGFCATFLSIQVTRLRLKYSGERNWKGCEVAVACLKILFRRSLQEPREI